jgi:hypothetical protein
VTLGKETATVTVNVRVGLPVSRFLVPILARVMLLHFPWVIQITAAILDLVRPGKATVILTVNVRVG